MRSSSHFYVLVVVILWEATAFITDERNHKKRQIYREEVLPHAGGRIPDTAFETDRLFLNQLQKDGIAVPDGVVPEQRNPQVYPFYNKPSRTVFRIALSSDGRYVAKEGRYIYQDIPTIETTYLYPQVYGQQFGLNSASTPTPTPTSAYPVYRPFQLHNPQLNQVNLQPKKNAQHFFSIAPSTSKSRAEYHKTESYQNFNIINAPIKTSTSSPAAATNAPAAANEGTSNQYLTNYKQFGTPSHFFNEYQFDDFFNNFHIHETPSDFYGKRSAYRADPLIY